MTPDIGLEDRESEGYQWCIEDSIEAAKQAGFQIVESSDSQLLLDLDTADDLLRYNSVFSHLRNVFALREVDRWKSKSGKGLHVVVACNPLPFPERAALQACLGSDPIREGLAIAMHRDGKKDPSVLFMPKR